MSWMNGFQRKEINYNAFIQPTSLAIDFHNNQTVYYCDQKADVIGFFGWDGENVRILVQAYQMRKFYVRFFWSSESLLLTGHDVKVQTKYIGAF